jgi:nucleoside-diphosphate-sugar epimerase
VYGTARRVPIDENHPLQPQSPYSATKIAADALAMSFFHAFGLSVTVARPFNTFGPRQSARAVIPTVISQILSGRSELRLGNLRPTRDFNYVEDTCRGVLALAECEAAVGQTVNIGSNSEISIGKTVELIKELMGSRIEVSCDEARLRPETSEVDRLWCDNTKIQTLTGFRPSVSFREGLQKTIDWFRKPGNLRRYKADIYNV